MKKRSSSFSSSDTRDAALSHISNCNSLGKLAKRRKVVQVAEFVAAECVLGPKVNVSITTICGLHESL